MLPFLPRKVAKALGSKKNGENPSASTAHSEANGALLSVSASSPHATHVAGTNRTADRRLHEPESRPSKGKVKDEGTSAIPSDEDCTVLLCLATSEYALWLDADLRRRIELGDQGFIPLVYLVSRAPQLQQPPSEATLAKAIRAHASDVFDVRMAVSAPSRAEWYGRYVPSEQHTGAFEIRLKDWKEVLDKATAMSHSEWDARTIYVENVPLQHRSLTGIHRFVTSLCASATSTSGVAHVQAIVLPKHHLDKPGDPPKCKGFALVTLTHTDDVSSILQRWPWTRETTSLEDDAPSHVSDATKYGFRTMTKARWIELNSEYLHWRRSLLADIAAEDSDCQIPAVENTLPSADQGETSNDQPIDIPPQQDPSAPYPSGCLVHVRHVHPETNKTTLRKLFGKAFSPGDSHFNDSNGIDYVDFNKGMDTCYLRLATAKHTAMLIAHFAESPTVQTKGLDDTGNPPSADSKLITIEVVQGTREELYWFKVPEKSRRQAVEKAAQGFPTDDEVASTHTPVVQGEGESHAKASKRKRRR